VLVAAAATSEPDLAHWLIAFVPSVALGAALVLIAR
jgi:hypothetical protein